MLVLYYSMQSLTPFFLLKTTTIILQREYYYNDMSATREWHQACVDSTAVSCSCSKVKFAVNTEILIGG